MLHQLNEKEWTALLKPWPIKPAVEGGFSVDDFTVNHQDRTATCPAGVTRRISAKGNVTFAIACRQCPLTPRCTSSARGHKLVVGRHGQLQRTHRKRAADESFQTIYRQHRPMVERSISWLTRGVRRVPCRGVKKNNNWLHHRVAALDLRRLLALGLTVNDGAWILA